MEIDLQIKNFAKQQTIFDSTARYRIAPKGRRFGLTKGAANDFILKGLEGKFQKGFWLDTVNTNIDRYVERYFLPHLKKLPKELWDWKQQKKILYIKDSYIDFRSSDRPENIEGFGYDKFFINEAGIVLKNEYLWHNAIRPMFWDGEATGVIGGTPKGKGVFYNLAQRAKEPNQDRYALFHFTSFDNPYLNRENLEEEIKDMPERVIAQEVYAEFLDDSGVVFRNVRAIATAQAKAPEKDHLYVIGVDLAKVQDYTVLAVYDRATNDQVYQLRFNQLDWSYVKGQIAKVATHYNRALCLVDATGVGDPIVEDLLRAGVAVEPIKFTNEVKKQLIEKLSTYIEQRRIKILSIEDTIDEFNSFTYDVTLSGKIRYEAPVGMYDDIVIAHALAVWKLYPVYRPEQVKEPTPIQIAFARAKMQYEKQQEESENPEGGYDEWAEAPSGGW